MSELRASVVMDLRGNLERQARRYEGAMRGMATSGQRHMGRLQRVTSGVGRTIDRVGNRWVALATGAAGVGVARSLVNLEERWERLGISIGENREEMEAWRQELRNIARAEGVRIDADELTSAVELVAQSIQDVDWARQSMEGMAVAIAATGESGEVIGQLALEMHRFGVEADDVIRIFDTLERQQDGQRITLQGMAQVLPELLGEYSRYGREGADAVTELGAALTTVVEGGMEPSRARRSIRTVMEVISDPEWQRSARRRGIALEDEAGQTRALTEVMRDLAEFQSRTSFEFGDMGFSEQATRAFNALTSDEGIRNLERLIEIQGDGEQITAKSGRSAETTAATLRSLREAWRDFADSNLSGHIQSAADALESLDQETVDRWLKIAGIGAGGIAGMYALRSVGRLGADLGRGARSVLRGTTTGGIAGDLGRTAGRMTPIPVFVTNMGAFGGGGADGPGRRRGPLRRTPTPRGPAGGSTPTTRKGAGYTPPNTRHATPRPRTEPPARRTPEPAPRSTPATQAPAADARPTPPRQPAPRPEPTSRATAEARPQPVPRAAQNTPTPRPSPRALGAAATAGSRALPGISAGVTAWTLGDMVTQAIERTDIGGRMGDYATLASEIAKAVAQSSFNNARERIEESVVRITLDQEGRIKEARPERGRGGPEIDIDTGPWGLWP